MFWMRELQSGDWKGGVLKVSHLTITTMKNYVFERIGFLVLLSIALVVLKLTSVINWSWWYILMPLWFLAALLIVGAIIYLTYHLFKK
jgi:hypothetical protein